MDFFHKPVLLKETIDLLHIKKDGTYVDGTAGGGGHSEAILKKLTTGMLISIDQDPDAIKTVSKRLSKYDASIIKQDNFTNIKSVLKSLNIQYVDGVLLDIGVSSYQFDEPERGFSYNKDAKLDMRMSKNGYSAYNLVNELDKYELGKIIRDYGEEKFFKSISNAIVKSRAKKEIKTTLELAEIIKNAVPAYGRRDGHPARKTFQALRIKVNDELENLSIGLDNAFSVLKPGGRLLVITFHSLEDRIVKKRIADWCKGCECPKDFPICVCNKTPRAKKLTKKPIEASNEEKEENPRSRSAKLRGCIKVK